MCVCVCRHAVEVIRKDLRTAHVGLTEVLLLELSHVLQPPAHVRALGRMHVSYDSAVVSQDTQAGSSCEMGTVEAKQGGDQQSKETVDKVSGVEKKDR